jgi:hypothetical protein
VRIEDLFAVEEQIDHRDVMPAFEEMRDEDGADVSSATEHDDFF